MAELDQGLAYDVFLSHHAADKPAVEIIASKLQQTGLRPFLDKWHLAVGKPFQEELEVALERSTTCAVFIGPRGLGPWQNEEMRTALDRRVRDQSFRVIPVLLPGPDPGTPVTLPAFLSRLTCVDFRRGLEDPEAFGRLVSGIRGTLPESALPVATWLTIRLARGNSEERKYAARQLGEMKSQAVIPTLEARWADELDATVRYFLADALGEIGGAQAHAALQRLEAYEQTHESNPFALLGISEALIATTGQAD